MNSIHGHLILDWLASAAGPLSFGEISERLAREFPERPVFHVCDTRGLDLGELLALLEARGKLWRVGACYTSERGRICADVA